MIHKMVLIVLAAAMALTMANCGSGSGKKTDADTTTKTKTEMEKKVEQFASVKLTTNLIQFTGQEKQLLSKLFDAAEIMNELYWIQSYGDKEALMSSITDEATKKFVLINYGPWERLNDNKAFIETAGEKPQGANFYPKDMTKEEFNAWTDPKKADLYTMITRDEAGKLKAVPYSEYFKPQLTRAAQLIKEAAELAQDAGFKKYLTMRADALLSNDYRPSDMAWLDMKTSQFDFVIGPIETYEDALFGYKAAFEAFILVKDMEWSKKLDRFNALLPKLQQMLPVEPLYKNETPGASGNELNAYDVIFYAGDCNAGSKTIAINLPNDEIVRNTKGSRKLQLKNSMQAKFDKILIPIANILIDSSQRQYVKFDAFFTNTMFHEVAHGLGLGYLAKDKSISVRNALQNSYTSIEEGKADILGLWAVDQLFEMKELGDVNLMDYYTTFMAGIFRSIRFGAASAHGKANMMRFYFFEEKGAFTRNPETGTYKIDFEKMRAAVKELANKILIIQGNGDVKTAEAWIEKDGKISPDLQKDLDRVNNAGIPVDIVFEQGKTVLGL